MIVCICHDVKDHQIKAAIASGIDTMHGLKTALDIANCCGCCEPMVNDYLEQHHPDVTMLNSLAYAV